VLEACIVIGSFPGEEAMVKLVRTAPVAALIRSKRTSVRAESEYFMGLGISVELINFCLRRQRR
jgi:hypothetical protein